MTILFSTFFPDWLLVICLMLIACWLLFKFLLLTAAVFHVFLIMLKYAITGRWKEYLEKCKTDPDSLKLF